MEDNKFTIYQITKKIIGSINPAGDASIDDKRYENLKMQIELVDALVDDIIHNVTMPYSVQYSIKKSKSLSKEFMINLSDKIRFSLE